MGQWSIVRMSEVDRGTRIDPEFYQPNYLKAYQRIRNCGPPIRRLKDFCGRVTDGSHVTPNYVETGVPFLMVRDVQEEQINFEDNDHITEEFDRTLRHCKPVPGDILLTKVGSVGISAVVPPEAPAFNIFVSLAVLKNIHGISRYYLSTFLNSRFGRVQSFRQAKGISQPDLHLEDIREFLIPEPDGGFQNRVESAVIKAHELRRRSRAFYREAEATLLEELGLPDLDLSPQLFYERRYSETVAAHRLDAEYFQPKYYRLMSLLKKTGNAVRLGDMLHFCQRGIQPLYEDEGEILVINSEHVGKQQVECGDNRRTTRAFVEKNRGKGRVRKYDVLLNSTGYITIGRAQTLLQEVNAIADSHVSILRPKAGLDPVFLGLFLNSMPGFLQTERGWTGSSGQIELRLDVIRDFVVWMAPAKLQYKIRENLEASHLARQESQRLLADAKRMVEDMILAHPDRP